MVTEFDPYSKQHLEELVQQQLDALDIDYTPDDSLWVLESDKDATIITQSYMKAMWYEELISEGVVDGRVAIISGRKDT